MASQCVKCGSPANSGRETCTTCHLTGLMHAARAEARITPAGLPEKAPRRRPGLEPVRQTELLPGPEAAAPGPPLRAYSNAVIAGVHHGLHSMAETLLLSAAKFAATIGSVPKDVTAAQAFFDFNQKNFYNHMRSLLKALDGKKRLPGKKRIKPPRKIPLKAETAANKNLALALRFLRIYMQVEVIPMALMIGKSKAAIWHIECANHTIEPHVVAAYGDAFNLDPSRIYKYANALGRGAGLHMDPIYMVTKFVDIILRGKS